MSNIIDRILAEVCLDERIPDGIFDMSNPVHMEVLLENLTDEQQIPVNDAKTIHNKMVEGKYPERQAYNKDGLLVTFPTPQHKARAIQRGTHFEKDPTLGKTDMFSGGGQPPSSQGQSPAQGQPAAQPPAQPEVPQQNVFPPTSTEKPAASPAPASNAPAQGASQLPASDAPASSPPAASTGQSAPSALPPSEQPAAQPMPPTNLAVEPAQSPTGTPGQQVPPPNFDTKKTPQQRAAEAEVVKQIMRGDNTNQSLSPQPAPITEKRYVELSRVYHFAEQMGYKEAMQIILEAMNRQ